MLEYAFPDSASPSGKIWSEETIQQAVSITEPRPDRRVEPETKTAGGIFIPDTAQKKSIEGAVVAVGPGARDADGRLHPLNVKAGDRVLFGRWSDTEVKLDGETALAERVLRVSVPSA